MTWANKMITVEEAKAMLPKVGDRMWKVPTLHKMPGSRTIKRPMLCTVIRVHREHLWYTVRFDRYGYTESYKVPEIGEEGEG